MWLAMSSAWVAAVVRCLIEEEKHEIQEQRSTQM